MRRPYKVSAFTLDVPKASMAIAHGKNHSVKSLYIHLPNIKRAAVILTQKVKGVNSPLVIAGHLDSRSEWGLALEQMASFLKQGSKTQEKPQAMILCAPDNKLSGIKVIERYQNIMRFQDQIDCRVKLSYEKNLFVNLASGVNWLFSGKKLNAPFLQMGPTEAKFLQNHIVGDRLKSLEGEEKHVFLHEMDLRRAGFRRLYQHGLDKQSRYFRKQTL